MKITALEPQRAPGRYNLYVDGAFRLGLTEAVVARFGLRKGLTLDQALLDELEAAEGIERHWDTALRLLGRRPYSSSELRRRLARRGASEQQMATIVERLQGYGYLDDYAYARQWIRDRQLLRPTGRRRLDAELANKGIPSEIRRQVLAEDMDPVTERDQCRQAAEKALHRYRNLPDDEARQKVFAHLRRRGFDFEEIRQVLGGFLGQEPS